MKTVIFPPISSIVETTEAMPACRDRLEIERLSPYSYNLGDGRHLLRSLAVTAVMLKAWHRNLSAAIILSIRQLNECINK